eukprot:INCI9575.1.p1 GENE.INCI9575.1~~INCI9575.1.p1  ORF type:complete len:459 (-),score=80.77 INCI9575.1:90-1364(-)
MSNHTGGVKPRVQVHHSVPIHSNKHYFADNTVHVDGGSAGGNLHGFENSPMLPKNRAIRYFQSEPNAPLVRAEVRRHGDSQHIDHGNASLDDTLDSVDFSNFQNAHQAARIVAEQTQRRLERQRQLAQQHGSSQSRHSPLQSSNQHSHKPFEPRRVAQRAIGVHSAVTFSPRPKHSELGQHIKKLASASQAARASLSKGISPSVEPNRGGQARRTNTKIVGGKGSNSGSSKSALAKKVAFVAGPAFHKQEDAKALAKRRARARKTGAEYERSLARQKASKRAEQIAEVQSSHRERRVAEQTRQAQLREERRTARKEREAQKAREDAEKHRQLLNKKRELSLQRRRDEQTRYIAGIHQRLIERFKVLRHKVPALCSCALARGKASGTLAAEPWKNCAVNCPLYNNPTAYAQLVQQWFYAINQTAS